MRICFVNSNRPWGGGERWTLQYARLARDHGHQVFAVADRTGALAGRLRGEPGVVLREDRLTNLSFLNPGVLAGLASFFRANHIDTVVMSLPRDLKTAGPAARWAGVERVVYRRGIDAPVRPSLFNRWLYGRVVTRLICNSQATLRQVMAAPGLIPAERARVVHNGLDVAEFDARPVREAPDRSGQGCVIGCAARLTPQKGVGLLLDAAALLAERGRDFRLLVAGEGELRAQLEARAAQSGLAGRVEFLGFVEDVKSFYASLDVLALPSLWEGFGYALLEAACCSKPAVAFRVSSNPEVVVDGETGLLAEPGDALDLADKLDRLALDPGLAQGMGRAARRRALTFDTAARYREFEDALLA